MKIRQGFVSNSSSSSFILKGPFDELMNEVGAMARLNSEDLERPDCINGFNKLINDSEKLDQIRESNIGVQFRSCNYDTMITLFKPYHDSETRHTAYITTCNNVNWSSVMNSRYIEQGPSEDDEKYCDMLHSHKEISQYFYCLDDDLIIRTADHYIYNHVSEGIWCPKCKSTKIMSVSIRFDLLFQPHCTNCDTIITARNVKLKKIKQKNTPDNLIPGVL